jgi:hypothetical protein
VDFPIVSTHTLSTLWCKEVHRVEVGRLSRTGCNSATFKQQVMYPGPLIDFDFSLSLISDANFQKASSL